MIKSQLCAGIALDTISLGERARKDYGVDFEEFKESIKTKGLLQPIVLMYDSPEKKGTVFHLIAGARRFRAFEELAASGDKRFIHIPATVYDYTDNAAERKSMELIENIQRKDFSVAEAAQLRQEIHELQVSIHGEAVSGKPTTESRKRWSMQDTAALLGESPRSTQRNLAVAEAIKRRPELANAKTQKEILKVVAAESELQIKTELAKRHKAKIAPEGSVEARQHEICDYYAVKDCLEYLADIRTASVNMVNLDWPYGVDFSADKNHTGVTKFATEALTAAYGKADNDEKQYAWMEQILDECYRVLKPNSWLLVWYFIHPQHPWIVDRLTKRGFAFGAPALWTKGHARSASPAVLLGHSYETFIYARKGQPALAKGRTNIYDYARAKNTSHPAEKPIELMQDILTTFTYEGATILDPFLGSGNSILAAANLGDRQVFGCDLDAANKDSFIIRTHETKPGHYTSY